MHRNTISTTVIGLNTDVNTNWKWNTWNTCRHILPFINMRLDFNWLVTNKNNWLVIYRLG
jgi:hypothetical protein